MATREKVRELLDVSGMEKQNSIVVEEVFNQIREELELQDKEDFEEYIKIQRLVYNEIRNFMYPKIEDIYMELFTDEEIDDLSLFYSSPVFKKIMALLPEVTNKLLGILQDDMNELHQRIDHMLDNMTDEDRTKGASEVIS